MQSPISQQIHRYIYIYTCRCSQQFHRFIIVDTWNHSTISDFRNIGEESREKEQLQGRKQRRPAVYVCKQTKQGKETEEQGRRTYRPWEETGGEELLATKTKRPARRSTTRGDELVEEEGDRRGAASPAGLARRGGGSPAGSASRRAAQPAGPASRRRSRSRRVRLSLPFSPLSFSSAAACGFFPHLELCARALARGAILSRAMARVARLARFRAA